MAWKVFASPRLAGVRRVLGAEEDVAAHTIGEPVVDRTDVQIHGLERAECPLHGADG
jgi:hypothetical protein